MYWLAIVSFFYLVNVIVAAALDSLFIRMLLKTIPFKICFGANLVVVIIATAINSEDWLAYTDAASLAFGGWRRGLRFFLLLSLSVCLITTGKYLFYSRRFTQRSIKLWIITLLSTLIHYGVAWLYSLCIS